MSPVLQPIGSHDLTVAGQHKPKECTITEARDIWLSVTSEYAVLVNQGVRSDHLNPLTGTDVKDSRNGQYEDAGLPWSDIHCTSIQRHHQGITCKTLGRVEKQGFRVV